MRVARFLACWLFVVGMLSSGAASAASADPGVLLVLGDSLSAAYRIAPESGWVALLERRIAESKAGGRVRVVNASISGETTAGGLARLPALLDAQKPAWVLVELGANDGLRGLPLAEIRGNLHRIIESAVKAKARVILLGIVLPVNYGPPYRAGLQAIYRDLASEFNLPLVPFLLAGVAEDDTLLQDDGLHPTAAAQPMILETVWKVVGPLLQ